MLEPFLRNKDCSFCFAQHSVLDSRSVIRCQAFIMRSGNKEWPLIGSKQGALTLKLNTKSQTSPIKAPRNHQSSPHKRIAALRFETENTLPLATRGTRASLRSGLLALLLGARGRYERNKGHRYERSKDATILQMMRTYENPLEDTIEELWVPFELRSLFLSDSFPFSFVPKNNWTCKPSRL